MNSSANEGAMQGEVINRENYAFLMNVSRFTDFETFEIVPGHHIRKAMKEEIDEIRTMLEKVGEIKPYVKGSWELGEFEPHVKGWTRKQLETDRWRYFVIAFRGSSETLYELSKACVLSSAEPDIGPEWLNSPQILGMGFHSERLFQSMSEAAFFHDYFIDFCKKDFEELAEIHGRLAAHDHTVVDLERVVRQLQDLKALSRTSVLRFLGYFGVLESLLTHSPQPSDPYDSITRQMKKKLTLLNSRFPESIDYSSFGGANADTIWGKMYQYRSLIAHGGSPTFDSDLQILRSHQQALALVKATTKAVSRQALREPKLIADLRDC